MAYAVWLPPGYDRSRAWPCIVFLNGSGECGTDGLKQTWQGLGPALLAHPERWPFVAVLPQKPGADEEWEEREDLVFAALKVVQKSCNIDPERIALAGISQGGHGTWMIGARHPGVWSCLAPVCGYGRARTVSRLAAPGVGVPGTQGRCGGPARAAGDRRGPARTAAGGRAHGR